MVKPGLNPHLLTSRALLLFPHTRQHPEVSIGDSSNCLLRVAALVRNLSLLWPPVLPVSLQRLVIVFQKQKLKLREVRSVAKAS